MRPCGQGSGCRGQDTNRLSSRKPGSTIVPRVESKRAPHQRANLHPQPLDVGIERVLRTYERKEIHRTWHSKLSGPGGGDRWRPANRTGAEARSEPDTKGVQRGVLQQVRGRSGIATSSEGIIIGKQKFPVRRRHVFADGRQPCENPRPAEPEER